MIEKLNNKKSSVFDSDQTVFTDFGTPVAVESSKDFKWADLKPKSSKHHYLLIKNFKKKYTSEALEAEFSLHPGFEKVVMIPGSKNAYIKFEEIENIKRIIEENELVCSRTGQKIKMCMVNKLPLDLNEKSRILLITVYNEKIEMNIQSVYGIFKDIGKICKVIIFRKKNYQIFIEFETSDDASFFKEAFHNINYKGIFFLKIQFTQKNSLIVNVNNMYEHDFSKETKKNAIPNPINPILYKSQDKQKINGPSVSPRVELMNLFDECQTSSTVSPPKSLKRHTKKLHVLKASNLHPDIKHKPIFNLFSLYGTIEKIKLEPWSETSFIYFASEFDQITAYHYLNCIDLSGRIIFLELLQESEIETFLNSSLPEDDSNTVYYAKNKSFKPEDIQNKQKTINRPSSILYVFNLSKSVNLHVIKNLFEGYEKVTQIYYVNESKNSALCFFNSTEAAIHVLCVFKNMNIVDKSLKINFANESLLKGVNEHSYRQSYFPAQEFEGRTKFSMLLDMMNCTSTKNDRAGKERPQQAFKEFKLF